MKKLLAILLGLTLSFSLLACGDDKDDKDTDTSGDGTHESSNEQGGVEGPLIDVEAD